MKLDYEEEQIQGILTENIVTHLSMCSGYEGMGRGLRGIFPNLREIAYVEREGYACANLVAKIEEGELSEAPIFTDVKEFPYGKFRGCVDILSAGFPCQPFSSSGIRKGTEDPRHLFPFIADGVQLCRPNWVALENVEGIISCKFGGEQDTSVLKYVMGHMEKIGYEGAFTLVSASEEGAPHQRKRVFMLFRNADPDTEIERGLGDSERARLPSLYDGSGEKQPWRAGTWPSRPGEAQYGWEEPRVIMAYPEDWEDGRNPRVGEEQAESKSVSSSTEGLEDTNSSRGDESMQLDTGVSAEPSGSNREEREELGNSYEPRSSQCREQGEVGREGKATIGEGSEPSPSSELSVQTHSGGGSSEDKELGNTQHDGCTSTEDRGSTSSEQEEGRMQEPSGGCCEPRDESRDNVPYTEDSGCRGRTSTKCEPGERTIHSDECQGGEVDSQAERCSGDNAEVADSNVEGLEGYHGDSTRGIPGDIGAEGSQHMGNPSSIGSCGGSEDISGIQSEMLGEGSSSSFTVGEAQSYVGRIPDGTTKEYYASPEVMAQRVPRLRLLGNGIVPAQAERAYRILFAHYL